MSIAVVIRDQIKAIDPRALMAWGAKDLVNSGYDGQSALAIIWEEYKEVAN